MSRDEGEGEGEVGWSKGGLERGRERGTEGGRKRKYKEARGLDVCVCQVWW